jgi:small subunit ribosomal protein S11
MAKKIATKKKKDKRVVKQGIAFIQSTFNNTIVTITDMEGNVLAWSSAGSCGYKGSKKSTPYAATMVARNASEKAQDYQIESLEVRVKGPGAGRESAIRGLQIHGVRVKSIKDCTPIPHNGCRPRKRRRV